MAKTSAGLLLYREGPRGGLEVLLVHPGGPFWAGRDAGVWSIPKGEYAEDEDPAARAEEEFAEELGQAPPSGPRLDLGEVRQSGGKRVRAWAVRGDLDPGGATSNTFEMEWPPRSGQRQHFPEVDRAAWFTVAEARTKLLAGQLPLLERLELERLERERRDAERG
jgi:predicted NUDIX family NTP pyrophosphohydrolase